MQIIYFWAALSTIDIISTTPHFFLLYFSGRQDYAILKNLWYNNCKAAIIRLIYRHRYADCQLYHEFCEFMV